MHEGRVQNADMARKTTITIETDSFLILRAGTSGRAWCPRCAAEVEMIALEKAGMISNLEHSGLHEWLGSDQLHLSQDADGSVLLCLSSLLARVQNQKSSRQK
jgi:hypothetical protein